MAAGPSPAVDPDMYDVIVLTTDGSELAETAAERGLAIAEVHEAAVRVICVAETGPFDEVRLPGDAASAEEAIRGQAETYVERLAERARSLGLDVETEVRTGTPKNGIVDYASSVDADLIVLGTHGRGGVKRAVLGSVAEHVVRVSDVDVLVVRDR